MEKRHILIVLATLALLSTGLVWAAADQAPATPPVQEEVEIETADELLDSLILEADAKGACCVAECYESFDACAQGCNNQACMADCRADLQACRSSC